MQCSSLANSAGVWPLATQRTWSAPLPLGEWWGEGLRSIERSEPPHPNPLPKEERERTEIAALGGWPSASIRHCHVTVIDQVVDRLLHVHARADHACLLQRHAGFKDRLPLRRAD